MRPVWDTELTNLSRTREEKDPRYTECIYYLTTGTNKSAEVVICQACSIWDVTSLSLSWDSDGCRPCDNVSDGHSQRDG
jgi:hypothetical protein